MNKQQSQDRLSDEWLSRTEAAAHLGITVSTLYRWETLRIGPPFAVIGGRKRYRLDAIKAWLAAREAASLPGGAR